MVGGATGRHRRRQGKEAAALASQRTSMRYGMERLIWLP